MPRQDVVMKTEEMIRIAERLSREAERYRDLRLIRTRLGGAADDLRIAAGLIDNLPVWERPGKAEAS